MRVLIVDDEPRYGSYLEMILSAAGHDVEVAQRGRQAIERGLRFAPEVAICDWLLKGPIHGLHVAAALQAAHPTCRVVLITAFPSEELQAQVEASQFGFLTKPFTPRDLMLAVEFPAQAARAIRPVSFGVLVASREGRVLQRSPAARSMLAEIDGATGGTLQGIFGEDAWSRLGEWAAPTAWGHVTPRRDEGPAWWVGARVDDQGIVLVLLPHDKQFLHLDPRVRLILDRPAARATANLSDRAVLVIDRTPVAGVRYVDDFERTTGGACYKVPEAALGLRILGEDARIRGVVLDESVDDADLPALVERLRATRDDVTIVGAGTSPASEARFAAAGVTLFVRKPWRVGEVLALLD